MICFCPTVNNLVFMESFNVVSFAVFSFLCSLLSFFDALSCHLYGELTYSYIIRFPGLFVLKISIKLKIGKGRLSYAILKR
jgi:hypothetical protein